LPVKKIKFCINDNDLEIDSIEKLLKENKIAFILSEVIQGEVGYNVVSKQFITNLKFANQCGVPLILDKVQFGMGRTGKWWAFEHYNIKLNLIQRKKEVIN
jgi:4-aminobutyrate aminotransferase